MKTPVLQYQRQLKKALCCGYAAKKRLLGKFHQQLQLMLEDFPEPDYATLVQAFGSPEQAALELMRSLTDAERAVYRREVFFLRFVAAITLVAVLIFAGHIYLDAKEGLFTVEDSISPHQAFDSGLPITRTQVVRRGDTTIATISFDAMFQDFGAGPTVVAKVVTKTDSFDGWTYTQESFTEADGTVTLTYRLSKHLFLGHTFSVSLIRCDDGKLKIK